MVPSYLCRTSPPAPAPCPSASITALALWEHSRPRGPISRSWQAGGCYLESPSVLSIIFVLKMKTTCLQSDLLKTNTYFFTEAFLPFCLSPPPAKNNGKTLLSWKVVFPLVRIQSWMVYHPVCRPIASPCPVALKCSHFCSPEGLKGVMSWRLNLCPAPFAHFL